MKFSAAAVVAASAVASGAAIEKRSVVYQISDFSAACIPHSTQCLYEFGVFQPGTMQTTPIACKAMVSANIDGTLPNVMYGACEQSSRTFNVVRDAEGLAFLVQAPVSPISNTTGTYHIPNSDLVMSDRPNAIVQSYAGPKNFDLQWQG
ncbi:uncharacterized protein PG998_008446 [Apiospora kogelbergensis]|uniref:Hypersensitive response-inducing protein n=1 Tax=Apiospora kogelbergensis TaxID=1337665 RepID=A0AAW0QLA0_9PEZI